MTRPSVFEPAHRGRSVAVVLLAGLVVAGLFVVVGVGVAGRWL